MKKRKLFGIVWTVGLLLTCICSGAWAELRYNANDQKWRNLETQVCRNNGADPANDYYGTNCYLFVDWVLRDENRGNLSGFSYAAYLSGLDSRKVGQYLNSQHNGNGPSEATVRAEFQKAGRGDVVQMYWGSTYHTALINGFDSDGVYFFQSHVSGKTVKKITSNHYTYASLARSYTTPGWKGGFTIYRFGEVDPQPTPDLSDINPGLRMLTTTKYAKSFTLTSGRYDVYSDSSLSTKLNSNYTGYEEEDWITGVGKNSSGTVYAQVSIPTNSGRKTVYVSLKKVFVPGNVNEAGKTAQNRHYGLYKRRNSGKNNNYGVDAGDTVYRLTDDGTWVQIMYPITGYSYWRIAWLTKTDYNKMMGLGTPPKITTTSLPDAYVDENYNAKLSATGTKPITWEYTGTSTTQVYGFRLDGKTVGSTSTNGVINGKIVNPLRRATPFTVKIKITAKNAYGSTTKEFPITVRDRKPVITTSSPLPQATQWRPYSVTLKASGATPITWSISSGSLPRGLSINKSSGKISGTPAVYGTFKFTVKASNSKGSGTKAFTLVVNRPPSIKWTLKDATAGTYYSDYVTVNYGTSPFKAAITRGSLPSGISVSVSGSNVYFKGTPKTAGTYSFTLRITDKNGATATKVLSITVKKKVLTFTYSFASATKGRSYSDWVKVSGGTTPYTVSVSSGKLPNGLSVSVSGERIYIKGTPKATGTYTFTLKVKSKNGIEGSKQYSISVIKSLTTSSASSPAMLGTSAPTQGTSIAGQTSTALIIPLSVSSENIIEEYEGRDSDIVRVRAGKSLTFLLGYWDDAVRGLSVFVDGVVVEDIRISDEGMFTLPSEFVRGDFKVCVKSQSESETLESEELFIIAE